MKGYLELLGVFFKIGLFTVGGGMAMLPLIQHTVVERKKWMTEQEIVDCFAVCQALPGVVAINSATYIGKQRKGFVGAVAASLGVMLPSFIIILLAVLLLESLGHSPHVEGALTAVKASSAGLILYAGIRLSRQVIRTGGDAAVALISWLAVAILNLAAVWAILGAALLGLIRGTMQGREVKEES